MARTGTTDQLTVSTRDLRPGQLVRVEGMVMPVSYVVEEDQTQWAVAITEDWFYRVPVADLDVPRWELVP